MLSGWRGLGAFWLAVLLLLGGGAAVLQQLGPPPPPAHARPRRHAPQIAARAPAVAPAPAAPPLVTERRDAPPPIVPAATRPGRSPTPIPPCWNPMPGAPSDMLPRIAEDGRRPMQVYAAGFDRSSRRPRIGILLAGIGLNEDDSLKAIDDLPGGDHPRGLALRHQAAEAARRRAPGTSTNTCCPSRWSRRAFRPNDPGPRALMTGLSSAENLDRLRWLLAHVEGYVGVTDALGAMRGERFAGMAEQMDPMLAELGRRGLLYVDARPAGAGGVAIQPHVWSRDVDLVLDEPIGRHRREARATGADRARQGRRARPGRRAQPGGGAAHRRLGQRLAEPRPGTGAGQRPGAAAVGCGSLGDANEPPALPPQRRRRAVQPRRTRVRRPPRRPAECRGRPRRLAIAAGRHRRRRGPARRRAARTGRGDRHRPRRDHRRSTRSG